MTKIRKGQAPAPLGRREFSVRFRASFIDPAFRAEDASIARLEEIAWDAFVEGRKAPVTRKAGPGYVDPDYDLSVAVTLKTIPSLILTVPPGTKVPSGLSPSPFR